MKIMSKQYGKNNDEIKNFYNEMECEHFKILTHDLFEKYRDE